MTISRHDFNEIASGKVQARTKRDAPFSLRLSFEEKAALKAMAGDMPIGADIKAVLFDAAPHTAPRRKSKMSDPQALGRVLGALGKSRLPSNVNQLAKTVNVGALPVTPETEADLRHAERHDRPLLPQSSEFLPRRMAASPTGRTRPAPDQGGVSELLEGIG